MGRKKYEEQKRKRSPGGYCAVNHDFLRSETVNSLSYKASKLFLQILSQYSGYNNGDFCITWSLMRKQNWRSKQTLDRARKELLDKGIIEITRWGGLNRAQLYALTLYSVDECKGKLDVKPSTYPKNIWRKNESVPILKKLPVR